MQGYCDRLFAALHLAAFTASAALQLSMFIFMHHPSGGFSLPGRGLGHHLSPAILCPLSLWQTQAVRPGSIEPHADDEIPSLSVEIFGQFGAFLRRDYRHVSVVLVA